jgi:ethanolamine permease
LPHGWLGAFGALPFAIWFYLAIEGIANVAEEAKNPQRDLPRGFIFAMATLVILTAIALFGAVGTAGWQAVVYPNPADTSLTSDSPLPMAIGHVVGRLHPLFLVLTGIGLVGLIASFHGILIVASRCILEFGRVGFAPRVLGVVHQRWRTPVPALLANLAIGLLALATGKTSDIILLSVFGALTLYVLSMVSLFALRARRPELERPYRTPGYPVVPAIALVLALLCIGAMITSQTKLTLIYVGLLAVATIVWRLRVPAQVREQAGKVPVSR